MLSCDYLLIYVFLHPESYIFYVSFFVFIHPFIHIVFFFFSHYLTLTATDLLFKSLNLPPRQSSGSRQSLQPPSPALDNVTSAATDQEVPRLLVWNFPKWISTSWPQQVDNMWALGQLDYFMMLLFLPSTHSWTIWCLSVGGSLFFLCSSVSFLLSDARWSVKAW